MCDVVVVINDVEFHAHQLILCSVSKFFRQKLRPESQDSSQRAEQRLLLDNCCPESFQSLLNAIYSGQIKTEMSLLPNILRLAIRLEISKFVDSCTEFLVESLSIRNARTMLHLGHNLNLPTLRNAAQKVS